MSGPNTTEEMIPPAVVGEPKRVLREPVKRFRRMGFPSKAREYNERMGSEQMPIVRRGFQPSPSRRQFDTPQHASREIKALAISLGADLVGICRLRQAWVYADRGIPGPFAITLAMEMRAEEIEKAPGPEALIETLRVYHDLGLVIIDLAGEIARIGYEAVLQHPFSRTHILQIPAAMDAGLGVLGRNGLLITEQFGPRVRLAAVVTNIELQPDMPLQKDISRFCLTCRACRSACPGGAIPDEPQLADGVLKFKVDIEKCRPYFRRNLGCSICIKACPFSHRKVGQPDRFGSGSPGVEKYDIR